MKIVAFVFLDEFSQAEVRLQHQREHNREARQIRQKQLSQTPRDVHHSIFNTFPLYSLDYLGH